MKTPTVLFFSKNPFRQLFNALMWRIRPAGLKQETIIYCEKCEVELYRYRSLRPYAERVVFMEFDVSANCAVCGELHLRHIEMYATEKQADDLMSFSQQPSSPDAAAPPHP